VKLGDLILKARKRLARFRTVKSLADEVGVSLEHMRRVESNDSRPSGQLLLKIIETLEMSETEAMKAWVLLAKEQIDPITTKNVVISTSEESRQVANKSIEVLRQYYEISDEDAEDYVQEILKRLG
tara:strand:+ start:12217 stop:12594 length:378 start_codon:yes stop_codon:yes gene_type:complete